MVDDERYRLLSRPRFIGSARINRNGWDSEIPTAFHIGPEPSTRGHRTHPVRVTVRVSGLGVTGFKSMFSSGLSFPSHVDTLLAPWARSADTCAVFVNSGIRRVPPACALGGPDKVILNPCEVMATNHNHVALLTWAVWLASMPTPVMGGGVLIGNAVPV